MTAILEGEFGRQERTCPNCGWQGMVSLYDIGDGEEWACPDCDRCFPSNPVVGADGLTNAERSMREFAREAMRAAAERRGDAGEDD